MERFERLEKAVNDLVESAEVEVQDPAAGIDPKVVELARAGKEMEAAKLHVEKTGVSFTDAQRVVSGL